MTWHIEIENVGGIRSGQVTLKPGVNVIQAGNWQGKTSLMTALRAVLGGNVDATSVTSGESEGRVTLTGPVGEDRHTECDVRIKRRGDGIRVGEPYLSDEEDRVCADLFAFLDERNEIRTAIREGGDLTPLLTRPFDRMDIEERVRELAEKRREIESELDRAEQAAGRLPAKREALTRTRAELEELREESKQFEGTAGGDDQQETLRRKLSEKRGEQEQAQQSVARLRRRIEATEEELAERKAELGGIDTPEGDELEADLERARDRLSTLDAEIDTLEDLYNVNKRILDREHLDLVTTVERQLDDDRLVCWVCGESTSREAVDARLDGLGERIETHRESATELRADVDELERRMDERQRRRRRREQLQSDVARLETRLEERRSELEASENRVEELTTEVEQLEDRVEAADDRRSAVEQAIAKKEAASSRLAEEVAELEEEVDHRDRLADRKARLDEEIDDLRRRRERIVDRIREAFDTALERVLESFGPSFEAARLDKHTEPETGRTERVELVLAREGREISVDELSEGETELVGFIAALAAYEAFDVADRLSCILVDDVGGLTSNHLHTLATYLSSRSTYVVMSAYPEAGDFNGRTISPDAWDVVSDGVEPSV